MRQKSAVGMMFGAVAVGPAQGNETDRDGVEEFSLVEGVSDPCHRIGFNGELHALEQVGSSGLRVAVRRSGADFGDQGLAESENDVAVLVRVLKDRIALVSIQTPAAGLDHFVTTIQR